MSTLDRDAARAVLLDHALGSDLSVVLDALEGCVRPAPAPAPAQTIDRDALILALSNFASDDDGSPSLLFQTADRILALLHPVDGVTITRQEAAMAAEALYTKYAWTKPQSAAEAQRLLAARLEAAS